jgi:hypothetical protein
MDGERMSRERKKLRVYKEDVKTQHTAHWDWDYLPWKEIERRLKEAGVHQEESSIRSGKHPKEGRRRTLLWIAFGLILLAGLLLVLMTR